MVLVLISLMIGRNEYVYIFNNKFQELRNISIQVDRTPVPVSVIAKLKK